MFLKNTGSQVVAAQLIAKTDGSDITSGTTTVYVTKDGGTQSSVGTATHEGNGCWTISPAQADTNADHCAFTFVNSTAITATVNIYPTVLADILIAGIKADLAGITGESRRSVLNALRKLLNKWSVSGTTLTVYKEDDSTSAFTEALTLDAGANPVTASDPA
jgi:hypothetical protein